MSRKPVSPRALLLLTALGLVMPIAVTVILGLAALVAAMDDPPGSTVLKWIGVGLAVFWTIDLVALLLAQAINALWSEDDRQDGES
jgi:purine-cytosine permease-like protein